MSDATQDRFDQGLDLARSLPSQIVHRGALQHAFVAPVMPMRPRTPAEVAGAWRRLAGEIGAGRAQERLSPYLHVPFCAHRCRYCVYYSVEASVPTDIEAYLARLRAELDFYGDALRDVSFSTCYIGGGTPTVLSDAQLSSLLTHLDEKIRRKRGGEWGFECNPLSATPANTRIFKEHGFNRASFGVQTLNEDVLDGVNRGYQSRRRVVDTLKLLQEHGFWVNVDLIRGLPGESEASTLRSLEALLQLGPTQVTVYTINPETPLELEADQIGPVADSLAAVRRVAGPLEYEVNGGSTVYSLYDRSRGPSSTLLDIEDHTHQRAERYDDTTIEPCSLLGIGPTARGYIYGQMRYQNERYPVAAPFRAEAPSITGRTVRLDDEKRRFVVYRLEGSEGLRHSDFRAYFEQELRQAFAEELQFAVAQGLLMERDGAVVHATSDPVRRFATELLFVDPSTFDALLAAGQADVSDRSRELCETIVLKARGREMQVHISEYNPDHRYYHHTGRFGFFVPSERPTGHRTLRPAQESMLTAFSRRFDRVIREHEPQDVVELLRLLGADPSAPKPR